MKSSKPFAAALMFLALAVARPAVAQNLLDSDDDVGISPIRTKVFFNLSFVQPGYLGLDAVAAKPLLNSGSNQFDSDTYWEVRPLGRYRGYRAHLLIQRGNNRCNEALLQVDSQSGELTMGTEKDASVAKWLVRYAGRRRGYNAYYVQNLGRSAGHFDMQFLVVDQEGNVRLDPKPIEGAHWRMHAAPDLPSELIRVGK